MAKREEITNIVISIVLIFIGIFLLIYSHIGNLKAITLLYLVFLIYGLMKIIEYSFSSDKKIKKIYLQVSYPYLEYLVLYF